MSGLRNLLLALVLGLVMGGVGGYYTKLRFVQAERFEAVIEQRNEGVSAAEEMRKDESVLQAEIRSSRRHVEVIRSEVKKHEIVVQENPHPAQGPVDCRGALLGGPLVGLLNAARTGTPAAPAAGSDGEGAATSDAEAGRNGR